MRILMPVFALKFRSLVSDRTILCAISPYDNNPEAIMSARDPTADPADLTARLRRFHEMILMLPLWQTFAFKIAQDYPPR